MNSPANEQQEPQTMEDAIAEEFDRMEAGEAEESETENEEVAVSEEETEEVPETETEEPEEPEVEETAEEQLAEEVAEAEESDYTEPAPERWPDEIKEVYNALPPQARKAMLEGIYKPMQRSYTQATQDITRMRETLNPMLQMLEQNRNTFERMNVNPMEALRTQMAWAVHLAQVGPEQGLRDMQQAYGIGQPETPAQGQEYLTPFERQMKAQVDALTQQVQGIPQQFQQYDQSQQENAVKSEINNSLQSFVNEKTDDGKPAHPHVEKVASNIAGIIRGGLVRRVDDYGQPVSFRDQIAQAYDMACNLDPSIRTPAPSTRQVPKAKAAQKVGVVTKVPAGDVTSEDDDLNMDDFIAKTYDALDRRVG